MNNSRSNLTIFGVATILCLLFRLSTELSTRVVGGSEVNIEMFPFMLSLKLNDRHICGAAIISKVWGLTAAHCLTTFVAKPSNYSVRSGSSFKNFDGQIHKLVSFISHDRYNVANNDYDIAAFKVDPPFRFDETTQPINLPGNEFVDDDWGIVAGWGYFMGMSNVLSRQLRYAVLPKVDRNECAQDYDGRFEVTPQQVCYGFRHIGKDACKGDSGGPLVATDNTMIGITSWGDGCAAAASPGVYTTIFLMLDWITEKTGVKIRLR